MSDYKLSASPGDGRADGAAADAPARPRGPAATSRHGAISRRLTKYANYKTWADKVRSNWQPAADEPVDDDEPAVARR